MAFFAYMLRCADGRFYTGHTDDLERRFAQHRTGGYCAFTSRRLPATLVWSQEFPSRIEALEAERVVGGWSRAKKEALIRGDWTGVSFFARPPRERVAGSSLSTSLETNGRGGSPGMAPANSGKEAQFKSTPFASSGVEKPYPGPRP